MHILSIQDVVKQYGNHLAVNHISFDMPQGSIFGMLGPNGAGKTSLIRIITSITKADQGSVLLNGKPINLDSQSDIGYMPEERGLYKKMTVGEQLLYLAQLKGLSKSEAKSKVDEWVQKFEIQAWWNKKIEELSKGMSQKVQFIATVVHNPKLLILDEPFSGLDPINSLLLQDEIIRLKNQGTSIIFSTHRMEQVEEMCENIVLINKGKNVLQGNVNEIKQRFKKNIFNVEFANTPNHLDTAENIQSRKGNGIILKGESLEEMNAWIKNQIQNGHYVSSFKELLPTIGEIFIQCVGETKNSD